MKLSMENYNRLLKDLIYQLFPVVNAHYAVCEHESLKMQCSVDVALSALQFHVCNQVVMAIADRNYSNPKRAQREAMQLCDDFSNRLRKQVAGSIAAAG